MPKDKTPFRIKLARSIAGKSFIPNLDLHDRLMTGNGANSINDFNTKLAQLEGNLGWVAAANEAIVQGIIGVPLRLYRKEADGTRTEVFEHDLLDLLASPNAVHRYKQFADLHHTYVNLTGEGYILMLDRNGQPFEPKKGALPASLHILPAHGTELKLGATYYESVVRFNNNEYPISSVIRDLVPDPLDPYRGRSIIAASAKTIDTDEQMKDWNRRFFANNARPGLVFSTNEELSDEAYRRWKDQFSDEHTGAANAYKNLLIEGGSVQPYMMSQHDLDFLASRKYSRDEILAMMRVSPSMLGMVENVNKANNDGALEIHHKLNTIPRLDRFLDLLNAVLVTPYDRNFEFDFESPVPEDKDSKLKEAEGGVNKWMTIDEVRALYGMDPLPNGDGDQLYVQGIMTPLKAISSPSKPANTDDADEKSSPPTGSDTEGEKSLPKLLRPRA
jgi:HK97 family phage portal protein